jgi:OOP family OmpA-OmpF porin
MLIRNIMKNSANKIIILITLFSLSAFPQSSGKNWSFGFGGTYPRFVGITTPSFSSTVGYGGFFSLKRNFSEHSGLRFSLNYNLLESNYDVNSLSEVQKLNLFAGNIDYLYYFSSLESVLPYASFGVGGILYNSKNSPQKQYDGTYLAYQLNLGLGVEWRLTDNLNLSTEVNHYTASTNDLDGRDNPINKGLFGSTADSYMKFNVGFTYYFSRDRSSGSGNVYSGITASAAKDIDYNRIEEMIKKYVPKKEKEDMLVGIPPESVEQHWVLIGVNFDLNSARLTKESFPILFYSFQILQNNPEMNVEIQGYTDNTGPKDFNLKLSERRAEVVKEYLVSKGINADRLTVKGFGESDPAASNETPEGRELNRRIEFKIISN